MSTQATNAAPDPTVWDCRPRMKCVSSYSMPWGGESVCKEYAFVDGCVKRAKKETCEQMSHCMDTVFGSPYGKVCAKWQVVQRCVGDGQEYTVPDSK